MKLLTTFLLLGGILSGGLYYWKQKSTEALSTVAVRKADTAIIETRNIRFAVNAAGDIGPAEQVSVRPEVNGKIEELPVDVGDSVKLGQMLFKLDDRELQTQRQQEEKSVERSRLQLTQAERDFKRSEELFQNKLIAQELFEDVKTKLDLAKNELALRQKSFDLISDRLLKTVVAAPFDATVLTRPISVGQAVSGSGGFNSGTEILTIANLNDLIISAHVNQADVTRLQIGQQVDVMIEAIQGFKITGKVERVAPQSTLKNNIRGFGARIILKDVDKKVRPGMTANISIPVASVDNVVAAPLAGIFTETNQETRQIERYVWLKKDGIWERQPIRIGVSDYFFAEVIKGLAAGDEISLEDHSKDLPAATKKGGTPTNGVKLGAKLGASKGVTGAAVVH
ncbi:MAG: efflux RND transporter periplasmic adaptor subunit [Pedosphaera sp.]|nr:efflux RND transporter periplasmic adaptor subunit [Pedosphaera sp.]